MVTAVALPTSVLAAILFSWGQGLTLNILTLAGLTIAVGRVVDDAIVVLENSYRYIQEEGLEPDEAALRGTSEVASAITSSTLCTAAVFLPLGLVGGIVSKFFLPLSLTGYLRAPGVPARLRHRHPGAGEPVPETRRTSSRARRRPE